MLQSDKFNTQFQVFLFEINRCSHDECYGDGAINARIDNMLIELMFVEPYFDASDTQDPIKQMIRTDGVIDVDSFYATNVSIFWYLK